VESFWKEAEREIIEMSRVQKVFWLVIIAIVIVGSLAIGGVLTMQLVVQTIDLMKGKI
jgi:hypothetical protein